MVSRIESPWNYAVCYIETYSRNLPLTKATGFFWSHNERTLLVTNWHVLSGRDPKTRQPLHSSAALPDTIKLRVYKEESTPSDMGSGYVTLNFGTMAYPLVDAGGGALWFEHPAGGDVADIGFVDITEAVEGHKIRATGANTFEPDAAPAFYPTQDVFIIGYPLGLVAKVPVPVWKRGSIATEPTLDPDDRRIVYVDSATRSGMSGSIVLARHEFLGSYTKKDGSKSATLFARADIILGIYSGRIGAHHIEAQLGIVWKRDLIEETVGSPKRGSLGL